MDSARRDISRHVHVALPNLHKRPPSQLCKATNTLLLCHIQCDLQAPICANCGKKDLPCEYLDLQYHSSDWKHHHEQPRQSSNPPPPPPPPQQQQPTLRHAELCTINTAAASGSQAEPSTASRTAKRKVRQGQQGQYDVLTFRVDGATPSSTTSSSSSRTVSTTSTALVRPGQQARCDATLAFPANQTPVDLRQLRPPGVDKLVAHWHGNTVATFSLTDEGEVGHKKWDCKFTIPLHHLPTIVCTCTCTSIFTTLPVNGNCGLGGQDCRSWSPHVIWWSSVYKLIS